MNALQQLIRTRMADERWSYGDVARRGGVPRSTVHHLATHERLVRPPHPDTLAGLARGLDVPLEAVRTAAATAAGLVVWPEPVMEPEVEVLVASLNKLTPEDRRHVQALVDSLLHADPEAGNPARQRSRVAREKNTNSPPTRGS
jgi:hypothetical protein